MLFFYSSFYLCGKRYAVELMPPAPYRVHMINWTINSKEIAQNNVSGAVR